MPALVYSRSRIAWKWRPSDHHHQQRAALPGARDPRPRVTRSQAGVETPDRVPRPPGARSGDISVRLPHAQDRAH
eukprot:5033429-Pyramimonas_sp.AAC.1